MTVSAELTDYLLISAQIHVFFIGRFSFYSFSIIITSNANLKACFLMVALIHFQQCVVCVCVCVHVCVFGVSVHTYKIQQLCWFLLMRALSTAEMLFQ